MTALSDLLANAKGDQSVDVLIDKAEKATGATLDRSVIYRALKGEHAKTPREATLQSLSDVFGVDVRKLREAVAMPAGELGPWSPTPESARLDRHQRKALDQLIKAIVRAEGAADADDASTRTEPEARPVEVPRVRLQSVAEKAAAKRTASGKRTMIQRKRDAASKAGEEPQS